MSLVLAPRYTSNDSFRCDRHYFQQQLEIMKATWEIFAKTSVPATQADGAAIEALLAAKVWDAAEVRAGADLVVPEHLHGQRLPRTTYVRPNHPARPHAENPAAAHTGDGLLTRSAASEESGVAGGASTVGGGELAPSRKLRSW